MLQHPSRLCLPAVLQQHTVPRAATGMALSWTLSYFSDSSFHPQMVQLHRIHFPLIIKRVAAIVHPPCRLYPDYQASTWTYLDSGFHHHPHQLLEEVQHHHYHTQTQIPRPCHLLVTRLLRQQLTLAMYRLRMLAIQKSQIVPLHLSGRIMI